MPNLVTFGSYSTHSLAKTQAFRRTLKQIPELQSAGKKTIASQIENINVPVHIQKQVHEEEHMSVKISTVTFTLCSSGTGSKCSQGVVVLSAHFPDACSHTLLK